MGAAQVKHWITSNGLRSKFIEKENLTEVFSEKWLQHVDGAKLLKQLFADLTDHRYAYEKVNYGYNLTEKILRTAPSDFQQVTDSLKTMLN